MHEGALDLGRFAVPWFAALTVAANERPLSSLTFSFDGVELPVVHMVLALIGVLIARPLAKRRTPPLSFATSLLVTIAMVIVAELWVIETSPGLLFTFVVAMGLGFSGYSLIELAGAQIEAFIKRLFEAGLSTLDGIIGRKP